MLEVISYKNEGRSAPFWPSSLRVTGFACTGHLAGSEPEFQTLHNQTWLSMLYLSYIGISRK